MQNGRDVYETAYRAGWRPEPRLTVSAWADEHRVLGNRAGHAAIHWRTTTPYLQEITDALGPRSPARRSQAERATADEVVPAHLTLLLGSASWVIG